MTQPVTTIEDAILRLFQEMDKVESPEDIHSVAIWGSGFPHQPRYHWEVITRTVFGSDDYLGATSMHREVAKKVIIQRFREGGELSWENPLKARTGFQVEPPKDPRIAQAKDRLHTSSSDSVKLAEIKNILGWGDE